MKDADGRRLRERGRSPVPRAAAAQQCAAAHLVTNGAFVTGFRFGLIGYKWDLRCSSGLRLHACKRREENQSNE